MNANVNLDVSNIGGNATGYTPNTQHHNSNTPIANGENTVKVTEDTFINAIEKANNVKCGTTECEFSIHKETKQIMIKLIDTTTREVIKEFPSEKILNMVAEICKTAGIYVDEKR